MQLLDRYLTAIKFWLPSRQREDIAAELAANLQSEIDDRAAELGRPLNDDELAALLKQHGSPILVASRYQQEHRTVTFGRQLIGPILFPFYWTAIKVTLSSCSFLALFRRSCLARAPTDSPFPNSGMRSLESPGSPCPPS